MILKSIRWRLPVSYAAIALLAALSLGSVMLLVLNGFYARQERGYLLDNARALQPMIEAALKMDALPENFQNTLNSLAFFSQARIRVLDTKGTVISDSGIPNLNQMILLAGGESNVLVSTVPAELTVAGGTIQGTGLPVEGDANHLPEDSIPVVPGGTSFTLGASPYGYGFSSVNNPASSIGSTHRSSQRVSLTLAGSLGNLLISDGPAYGRDILLSVSRAWAGSGLLAVLLAGLAGWIASRQVTHPVLVLNEATQRMQNGDMSARVHLSETRPTAEFQSLANSFNGMAQRVEDTISTLRAFVADAAHELHTPMTALHTNLELAVDETDSTRRVLYLERAQEQTQRLEALVGGLLDLSRIEAVQQHPNFTEVDFNELLRSIGEFYTQRAVRSGHRFVQEIPGEALLVAGNVSQLRQIVTNLLENAFKFTPPGSKILLKLEKINDEAVLTVSDSGIGIPEEDLPHLFERFHRGRNASGYPGSGLGLAITRALVIAHNGKIQVESEVGSGTSMVVILPF